MDFITAPRSSASSQDDPAAEHHSQYLRIVAGLTQPDRRREVARELAVRAGAEDLIIFIVDAQVEALLPAPGFMQTLPGAREWRTFLNECVERRQCDGHVPFPHADTPIRATAIAAEDGSVLVLLGGVPRMNVAQDLCMLLPLLAAAFRGERMAAIAEGQAKVAREAAGQAKLLAASLDKARQALHHALRNAEAASATATAANLAKDQFLAVLSHELRTPLTPVLTATHMLQTDPSMPPDARATIAMIRRNVQLETRLIDDLLDLTRVSRGKLQLQLATVDLHETIAHVIEICESDLRTKQLRFTQRLGAQAYRVRADSARLQQIIWNLLKNAIKFTPEGGSIELSTDNTADGRIAVRVQDTGVGIDPASLPNIFDAFQQGGEDVTRLFGGLGLGLSITKALVDAHGGALTAVSPGKGRGSTFAVILPTTQDVATPPQMAVNPRSSGARPPKSGHILIVDDHADTSRIMARLLSRQGFTVRTADTVAGALKTAGAESFDLLISDIGLPDGSGLDLIRQLRATTPIKGIALSGFGMDEDVERSHAAGFVEHLTKPIDGPRLLAAVERVVDG
ncbi:MAG: Hybrid sensor histidine kinase/response regulator [Phycisphaerales bacterium]|nr:Hybrid sensor histidine kinase/response regulator [Phycisphaerales bacterium]